MRITNQMMTNNCFNNLMTNYSRLNKLNNQYTSQKKITRPSEDPVVAVRALKFRTTCSELEQYLNKNIPDANNWMDVTVGSLDNIISRLGEIRTQCTYGATDTLSTDNRQSILSMIEGFKNTLVAEGSTNIAGRYIFTGYKTDTDLVFKEDTKQQYTITEQFSADDFEVKDVVLGSIEPDNIDDYLAMDEVASPATQEVYRIRLAYNNTDATVPEIKVPKLDADGNPEVDADGNMVMETITPTVVNDADATAEDKYSVGDDEVKYVTETGELIFGKNVYEKYKVAEKIEVTYSKTDFEKDDLRPEHYFDCTSNGVNYIAQNQEISYNINFNQSIVVNSQAKDVIRHDYIRDIEDLANAIDDLDIAEKNEEKIKKMMEDPLYADSNKQAQLQQMLDATSIEISQKRQIVQDLFGHLEGTFDDYESEVNAARSDLGARMNRLELTEARVTEQLTSYTELKSENEDVVLEEVVVQYSSAKLVYEASLMATSKVVQQTLLDYL
ncbi:MAG: flagellar hook-associated protein FlgL [Lachnospiraceae bacterium]|nr:flagellar hook-associated protein FlgL [Lachnospiraceae bacterium]